MSYFSEIASAYKTMNESVSRDSRSAVTEDGTDEMDDQVYFVDVIQKFKDIEKTAMSICHDIKELVEDPLDKTEAEGGDYTRHPLYAAAVGIIDKCHSAQDEIDVMTEMFRR